MRVRWHTVGALLPLLLAAACRQRGGISFEQFVNTTVELRQAASQTTSPAAFEARKRAIEARHHVTDADLQRFTRAHAADVKLLSAAWDSVEARLDRAGPRDAVTHPVPGPPPIVTVKPGTITPATVTPGSVAPAPAPAPSTPPAAGGTPPRGRHDF